MVTSQLFPPERLDKAQRATAEAGIDALLLTPGPDLRYVTGYDAKQLERLTCLAIPAANDPFLVVPRLELPAAKASPAGDLGLDMRPWDEADDPYALVASLLDHDVHTVGLANRMWAQMVLRFRDALPDARQVTAGSVLRELRMRKSPAEVDALREAAAAIDRVHDRMGEWLRPGRTERAVGADIADAIRAEGHATVDFIIVGSGPHGASPHHEVSDRIIERGDAVVVDIGGTTPAGYCSDETRTYAVGNPPEKFASYYDALQRAQDAACRAVGPGVTPEAVDAAARDIIADAGYGDNFIHRLGHGIGLETHEEPYIMSGNTEPLEVGMTFSVEPGIYLPERHGARIEDIVVCTEDGVERLNRVDRDLAVLET